MKSELQRNNLSVFEQIRKIDEQGNEYWFARDMAKVLEYSEYRHFLPVIERVVEVALGQTYFAVQAHLQEIRQMEEYNRLSTEGEKRLFLRGEMVKHNTQLAAAAKDAGVLAFSKRHKKKALFGNFRREPFL